ncbi:hypothetical protein ACSMXM_05590 [Pacificimonas sp. ICDLI1SI03]
MTNETTVVPKAEPLTEEQFHAVMMQGLSRMTRVHGKAKVAQALGVSVRHLGNIAGGSLPSPDKLFNLLALDQTAHDEIMADYGKRSVPLGAMCSSDPVAAKKAMLLAKVIEAEKADSDGGKTVTLHEIIGFGEDELRDISATMNGWIARLDAARKPHVRAA